MPRPDAYAGRREDTDLVFGAPLPTAPSAHLIAPAGSFVLCRVFDLEAAKRAFPGRAKPEDGGNA
jgi:hypothetical protein